MLVRAGARWHAAVNVGGTGGILRGSISSRFELAQLCVNCVLWVRVVGGAWRSACPQSMPTLQVPSPSCVPHDPARRLLRLRQRLIPV